MRAFGQLCRPRLTPARFSILSVCYSRSVPAAHPLLGSSARLRAPRRLRTHRSIRIRTHARRRRLRRRRRLVLVTSPAMMSVIRLPTLQIDQGGGGGVAVAGLGHAGDFAHQFHVAFSASVSGACVFSGQPFNCAVSKFAQDDLVAATPHTRVPNCQGCPDGKTLPFDHCKTSPHVIDVGSMVGYPRRLTLSPEP